MAFLTKEEKLYRKHIKIIQNKEIFLRFCYKIEIKDLPEQIFLCRIKLQILKNTIKNYEKF
jgi:hypothetical protein